jgi:hypothetical protein
LGGSGNELVKKRILFLNTVYPHPAITEALEKKNLVVIAFSAEACVELTRMKIKFLYPDDIFPYDDWERLEAMSREFPEGWDKDVRQALTYRKVPIGQVFAREFSEHFRDIIKCFYIADKAIARFSPDEVVCSPSIPYGSWATVDTAPVYTYLPSILKSVCEAKGIPFEFLSGVENRQVFEVQRNRRVVFDMAVKGRNTSKSLLNRIAKGSKKNDLRVLSVILKKGMFEAIHRYGESKGVEVIPYYLAGDTFRFSDPSDLASAMKRIKETWAKMNDDGKFLPTLPSELSAVREVSSQAVGFYLSNTARTVMREVANLESALTKFDIDLLLCLEDFNPLGKARVAKAEAMDIPSVVVQHGIFTRKFHVQYSNPRVRYNFVWGPAFIDTYVNDGFPKDRVMVTGITSIDVIYSRPKNLAEIDGLMNGLGIPEDTKKILWTNTSMHVAYISKSLKRYIEEIKGVFELMKTRKEALIVKPHMNESPEIYRAIGKEVGYEPILVSKDLSKLIYGCDALLINNSTVGVQALLAGKPIVLFTTQMEGDFLGFVKEGVAEPAYTLEDLPKALDKVLYDDKGKGVDKKTLKRYLDLYASKPDGSGMTTVVDYIIKILKKDKKKGSEE